MGRGGGGHHGGGFSGGGSRGFSSHHSSSSSSHRGGSSFSSSRGRSSSSGSIWHTPLRPRNNTTIFVNNQNFNGNSSHPENRNGIPPAGGKKPKKKGAVPAWFKFLSVLLVILSAILVMASCSIRNTASGEDAREKLESSACVSSDQWLDDQLDWISDEKTVKEGMEYFYDKTGVQPYLLICDNIDELGGDASDSDVEDAIDTLYSDLYDDEGHMIFMFMEYAESEYATYVYTGVSADTVIDSDARDIILNYADRYYTDSSLSDEEYFAKVFEKSADKIMEDHSGDAAAAEKYMFLSLLLDAFVVGGLIAFHMKKKREKELEQVQEILNTPIGASAEEKDLERKYGEKDDA